jgi:hypothetical protein
MWAGGLNASGALLPGKKHTVRHEYQLFGATVGQDILKKRNKPSWRQELNLIPSVKQLIALRLHRLFHAGSLLTGKAIENNDSE